MDENNQAKRVGGVKYTIKDGIVYDAKKLLNDVKNMVTKVKNDTGETIVPVSYTHLSLQLLMYS